MTREEAKQLLPVIRAFANGKNIQFLDECGWRDVYETDFYGHPDKYRIKPETKVQAIQKRGRMLAGNAETSSFRVA